jgi:hypothetical protein
MNDIAERDALIAVHDWNLVRARTCREIEDRNRHWTNVRKLSSRLYREFRFITDDLAEQSS